MINNIAIMILGLHPGNNIAINNHLVILLEYYDTKFLQ